MERKEIEKVTITLEIEKDKTYMVKVTESLGENLSEKMSFSTNAEVMGLTCGPTGKEGRDVGCEWPF